MGTGTGAVPRSAVSVVPDSRRWWGFFVELLGMLLRLYKLFIFFHTHTVTDTCCISFLQVQASSFSE